MYIAVAWVIGSKLAMWFSLTLNIGKMVVDIIFIIIKIVIKGFLF